MNKSSPLVLIAAGLLASLHVQAAMPVVDVRAIAQAIKEMQVMKDQLTAAKNQLTQAQQQFQALTGTRGMERLLAGTARNYLPPDWAALESALRGAQASYTALTAQVDSALRGNAVLTAAQTARLAPESRDLLEADRRSVALMQVTSQQALQATSQRFASLQGLIDAIPTATDTKGALDLQARIAAEQAMLQNEHTKLMVLHQAVLAEERAQQQRGRELAIANYGSLRRVPPIGLAR
jgi:type IV secretion system protein VirB5